MHLKVSSAKWRPCCLSLNALRNPPQRYQGSTSLATKICIHGTPTQVLGRCHRFLPLNMNSVPAFLQWCIQWLSCHTVCVSISMGHVALATFNSLVPGICGYNLNSLAPGRCGYNLYYGILKLISMGDCKKDALELRLSCTNRSIRRIDMLSIILPSSSQSQKGMATYLEAVSHTPLRIPQAPG